MDSLNRRHVAEYTVSRMAGGDEKQPGNCAKVRGIHFGLHLADHRATVVVLPSGASIMAADHGASRLKQFRLGFFQRPGPLTVSPGVASVDLKSRCVGRKDDSLILPGADFTRNMGRGVFCPAAIVMATAKKTIIRKDFRPNTERKPPTGQSTRWGVSVRA